MDDAQQERQGWAKRTPVNTTYLTAFLAGILAIGVHLPGAAAVLRQEASYTLMGLVTRLWSWGIWPLPVWLLAVLPLLIGVGVLLPTRGMAVITHLLALLNIGAQLACFYLSHRSQVGRRLPADSFVIIQPGVLMWGLLALSVSLTVLTLTRVWDAFD